MAEDSVPSDLNQTNFDSEADVAASALQHSDDWLCTICMDYLMDAVAIDNCNHKFCRFCIDRWIFINSISRCPRCPICRGVIGEIRSLPELDETISNFLQSYLTPEELQQRQVARSQREIFLRSAAARNLGRSHEYLEDSWITDSLENQLVSNAIRSSVQAAQVELRLRNSRLLLSSPESRGNSQPTSNDGNQWATHSTTSIINRLRQSIDRIQEFQNPTPIQPIIPLQYNELHTLGRFAYSNRPSVESQSELPPQNALMYSRRNSNNFNSTIREDTTQPADLPSSAAYNSSRRQSPVHNHLRNMIEDDLVNQYNYHLRRVESAYSRMQEAQRDLSFHNQELMSTYNQYIANQNGHLLDLRDLERAGVQQDDHSIRELYIGRSGRPNVTSTTHDRASIRPNRNSWNVQFDQNNNEALLSRSSLFNSIRNRLPSHRYRLPRPTDLHELRAFPLRMGTSPSEFEVASFPSQNLRVTREEVHIPPETSLSSTENGNERIIECDGNSGILRASSRSPLRTFSESTGRRNFRDVALRNRQERRSVQFQNRDNDLDDTPVQEFPRTPTPPALPTLPSNQTHPSEGPEAEVQEENDGETITSSTPSSSKSNEDHNSNHFESDLKDKNNNSSKS